MRQVSAASTFSTRKSGRRRIAARKVADAVLSRAGIELHPLEPRLLMANFVVTTFLDVVNANDGLTSLREAVQMANLNGQSDTISLPAGTYNLTIAGTGENAAADGDLDFTEAGNSVTITTTGPVTIQNGGANERALEIFANVTVSATNVAFFGFNSGGGNGGAILNTGGTLNLSNTRLDTNNSAGGNGGAIANVNSVAPAAIATLSISNNSTVIFNSTGGGASGGAIFNQGGAVTITQSTFSNGNSAVSSGGAIHNDAGNLTITNTGFDANRVSNTNTLGGGAIFNTNGGTVSITGGSLTNNTVTDPGNTGGGGGIYNFLGAVTLENVNVSTNTANFGGGVYNDFQGVMIGNNTVTINNSTIQGNTATTFDGGGIFNFAVLNLTNTNIVGNTASDDGGGIDNAGGTVTITGGSVNTNTANGTASGAGGGGLYNETGGTLTITGTTIKGNTTAQLGGGLFNENGGTINLNAGVTIGGPLVSDANSANGGGGGGIANGGGAGTPSFENNAQNATGGIVNITGATIQRNTTPAGSGGGILNITGGVLTLTNTTISNNTAPAGTGGGIQNGLLNAGGGISLTITGGTISNNTANVGGGIHNDDGAVATLFGVAVNTNTATAGNFPVNLFQGGGGLFNDLNGTVTINGGSFNTNSVTTAGAPGGGILNSGGTVTIIPLNGVGTTITGNTAGRGAGIHNTSDMGFATNGTLNITGATISNNTAAGNGATGGGIENIAGPITINTTTISGNTVGTDGSGGGIENFPNGGVNVLTITNSTIGPGNQAPGTQGGGAGFGGGINNNDTLVLTNTTVSGNTAQFGGGINNAGTATLTHATITLNSRTVNGAGSGLNSASNTTTLDNTILFGNVGAAGAGEQQFTGNIAVSNQNIIGTLGGSVTLNGGAATPLSSDPLLGPLQNNGGPTFTHALGNGSPALDGGSAAGTTTDQRGFTRPVDNAAIANAAGSGDGSDIGAFEAQVLDIAVTQQSSGASIVAGAAGNLTYTVTAANNGPSAATNVIINEALALPTGATVLSTTPSTGAFDPNTGNWTIPALANGASATLTIIINVAASAPTGNNNISSTASVAAVDQAESNTNNNVATVTTSVARQIDLVVSSTESADPVQAGSGAGNLVYVVTVNNAGPSNASGVTLTDMLTLPTGVTLDNAQPSTGTFNSGVWTLGNLNSGSSATLSLTLTVGAGAAAGNNVVQNVANVSGSNETRINTGNDSSTQQTSVTALTRPDLAVTLSDGGAVAAANGTVTYTVNFSNTGNANAAGVTITQTLPANTTFNAAASSAGWVNAGNGNFTFAVGNLAAAGSGMATFAVTVNAGFNAPSISTTSLIGDNGAAGPDSNPNNNSAMITTSAAFDLSVNVAESVDPVTAGSGANNLTYTVTVNNAGPGNATGVMLSNVLTTPTGVALVSATPSSGTFANNTWNLGNLASGGSATLTIVLTVGANTAAGTNTISNAAAITAGAGADSNAGNNMATAQTSVQVVAPQQPRLDPDGNGAASALEDGRTIIGFLLGRTGAALTQFLPAGSGASAQTITNALTPENMAGGMLDVDGNGTVDALTDGRVIISFLLGRTGGGLTQFLGAGATRNTAAAISNFLNLFLPGAQSQGGQQAPLVAETPAEPSVFNQAAALWSMQASADAEADSDDDGTPAWLAGSGESVMPSV